MHEEPSQLNVIVADIKDWLATLIVMLCVIFLASITSCTKEQQAQVKTVLQAADKGGQLGCVLFPALPVAVPGEAREVVEDVCLGADEVRQAIADYQRGKAARKAAASASAAPPSPPASSARPVSSAPAAPAASGSAGAR